MTTSLDDTAPPSPIELMDSARTKYTLAQSRLRRGPPELALLSLHGSLEDALRSHALRRQLPEGAAPFLQLLDALLADAQAPLSVAEAEGVRRMHRLRARVAHGEQIAVTSETIVAYQRLAAKLLPRYGVLVVAPEGPPDEEPATATTRRTTTLRIERAEAPALRPGTEERRRGETGRSDYPLLDRYPELDPRRRARAEAPRSRRDRFEEAVAGSPLGRVQSWLIPVLIVVGIFVSGLAITIGLQQLAPRQEVVPQLPNSAPTSFNPTIGTAGVVTNAADAAAPTVGPTLTPAPTEPPPDAIVLGRTVYVQPGIDGGLAMRSDPGTASTVLDWLESGSAAVVVGGPREAEGRTWWQVSAAGREGWCAGEFLEVR